MRPLVKDSVCSSRTKSRDSTRMLLKRSVPAKTAFFDKIRKHLPNNKKWNKTKFSARPEHNDAQQAQSQTNPTPRSHHSANVDPTNTGKRLRTAHVARVLRLSSQIIERVVLVENVSKTTAHKPSANSTRNVGKRTGSEDWVEGSCLKI